MANSLVQQTRIRTNATKDSVCSVNVDAVSFGQMWESYPSGHPYVDPKTGKAPQGFSNQCAIKVIMAIHGAGIEMRSFNGAFITLNGRKTAYVAAQLAAWLTLQPFCGFPRLPDNVTGKDWQDKINDRTGITYFANYWARDASEKVSGRATGDHIDLWNGSRLTATGMSFLSTYGRYIGINAVAPGTNLGYSDIRNSTEILFWEIK